MGVDRTVPRRPFFEVLTEIQTVLGADNPKIMSRVGMNLGKRWGKSIHDEVNSIEELFEKAANYLQNELKFAEKVEVEQPFPFFFICSFNDLFTSPTRFRSSSNSL